jgi:hypothetical protein
VTRAEQLSVVVTSALACAAAFGYAIDAAGFGLAPLPSVALAAVAAAALGWRWRPAARAATADLLVWTAVVLFVLAAIVRLAWPALLPPGRGPDLTHHLLLVDYIEQQRHLVHDRSLDGSMGEMAHYTPGAHLLAVSIGALIGSTGLRVFFPLLAITTALTAGFVFLIARRLRLPIPYAIGAAILLFLPSQYFYGAFTHDGFLAQALATFFAVACLWALTSWDEHPYATGAVFIGLLLVAIFLTWPILIGPPVLVFVALALRPDRTPRDRFRDLLIGLAPLFVVASIHVVGRWGWLAIVRTSGAVLEPSLQSFGWALPLLALVGIPIVIADRRARVTLVFLLVILLQGLTLFVAAKTQGASTPYMAFKMAYLAIYPMAALAAVAMASPERAWLGRRREAGEWKSTIGWILASLLVILVARPALTAPRVIPVVDLDLYEAGKWTRANVGQACVDYLVADAQTAYWLHLAVLGNPRASERMIEIDRYDPRAAAGPWITSEGRSYAIADLRLLPDEVRSRVDVIAQYGRAAVIRRRDATMKGCD